MQQPYIYSILILILILPESILLKDAQDVAAFLRSLDDTACSHAVADVVDVDELRVAERYGIVHGHTALLPSAAGAGEKQEDREAKEYVT